MDNQYLDPEQQKAIEQALMEKYKQASDTTGVDEAFANQKRASLIAGIGQALETAARANSMARGGQGVNPAVYNGIQQRGNQEVQNAMAKRQMAIDEAMKNIELNRSATKSSMDVGNYNRGIDTHNLDMQKGQKDLAAADQRSRKADQDLALGQQQLKAGSMNLHNMGNNQDPMSNLSKLKQETAAKMVPGKDFSQYSGAELDAAIPALSDIFNKNMALEGEKLKLSSKDQGLTEGQKAADREFAKEHNEWVTKDRAQLDKNLQRLEEAKAVLEKRKNDSFGTSGRITGLLPDVMRSNESIRLRDDVRAAAQGALRATLGSQFTEREGERIMNAAYNEKLPPEENIRKIEMAINELRTSRDTKEAMSREFEDKGSVAKFKATPATDAPKTAPKTGFEDLSDADLQERINKLKAGR